MTYQCKTVIAGLSLLIYSVSLQAEIISTKISEKPKSFKASASGTRYMGFEDNAENMMLYRFGATYQVNDRSSIAASQALNQYEVIDPGSSEVQVADTSLSSGYKFGDLDSNLLFSLSGELTAPISETSRRNKVISKPYLNAQLALKELLPKVKVLGNLWGRYHVNRYKTTPTAEGDGGGQLLRHYESGLTGTLNYEPTKKLSLLASFGWQLIRYETPSQENANSPDHTDQRFDNSYVFALGGTYELYEFWSFNMGIEQADSVERSGGTQVVAFDPYVTQAFVGTTFAF